MCLFVLLCHCCVYVFACLPNVETCKVSIPNRALSTKVFIKFSTNLCAFKRYIFVLLFRSSFTLNAHTKANCNWIKKHPNYRYMTGINMHFFCPLEKWNVLSSLSIWHWKLVLASVLSCFYVENCYFCSIWMIFEKFVENMLACF